MIRLRPMKSLSDTDRPAWSLSVNAGAVWPVSRRGMGESFRWMRRADHPDAWSPVMFPGEDGARMASAVADAMLADGIYVIAFSYPVVPQGKARIRVQLSAAHSEDDVRACVAAFVKARASVG